MVVEPWIRGWLVPFGDDFEGGFGWVKGGDGGEDLGGFALAFVVTIGKGMVAGFKGGDGVRARGVDEGGNDHQRADCGRGWWRWW